MKLLLMILGMLQCAYAMDDGVTFLVKEKESVIVQEGDCTAQYSPCSTFKIALSLMGYDSDILQDQMNPQWLYQDNYDAYLPCWREPQTPTSWMKNSCVWYSQVLTPLLTMEKLTHYVFDFEYGNRDVSGDAGCHNGLTHAWLSSSLNISVAEQAIFLQKLIDNELPVSAKAHHMTRDILFVEDLENGWKLYGKTGSGYQLNRLGLRIKDRKHGWYVGWIQKEDRALVFVYHLLDHAAFEQAGGPRAKAAAREKLLMLIQHLDSKEF